MFNPKFYKIGMISLLFIPIICIPYLKVEYKKRDFRLLKLNMPDPGYRGGISYDYSMLDKIRKEVVFKELGYNASGLESAISEFSELDSNQAFLKTIPIDYQYGLRIKLSNQTSYETFVNLVSLCHKYQVNRYAFDIRFDELYIFDIFNRPKVEEMVGCVSPFYNDLLICSLVKEKTLFDEISEDVKSYINPVIKSFNKTVVIFIGFLTIVFVAYRNSM